MEAGKGQDFCVCSRAVFMHKLQFRISDDEGHTKIKILYFDVRIIFFW